ncbi:MAG: SDR family NAD(P)-dependent oxidoreductase, partial [SAR324 cluster bacterium]|nr:SDR family NAD(P)-dependent oxidoreductase [SAR324 cluster bacterium]
MNDRVVLVTGGANGLGRDIALVLGGKGWRVALADMDEAGGRAVVREIESAGGTARFYPVDLATPEGAREMVAWTVEHFGRLDVLINNAALMV